MVAVPSVPALETEHHRRCSPGSVWKGTARRGPNYLCMPRYFFHLEGSERIADKRGQELPNDDAARREAEAIVHALGLRSCKAWRVTVTDENGEDITEALLVGGNWG
jgi:hypothetical protein